MRIYSILEALEMMYINKNLEFEECSGECEKNVYNTIKFNDNTDTICWGGDADYPIHLHEDIFTCTWKKIDKPITFNDVLNSENEVRVEHKLVDTEKYMANSCRDSINDILGKYKKNKYIQLNEMMLVLSWFFGQEELKDIIKNGKWYLKSEEELEDEKI